MLKNWVIDWKNNLVIVTDVSLLRKSNYNINLTFLKSNYLDKEWREVNMPRKVEQLTHETIDSLDDNEVKKKYKNLKNSVRYLLKNGYNNEDKEIVNKMAMITYIKDRLKIPKDKNFNTEGVSNDQCSDSIISTKNFNEQEAAEICDSQNENALKKELEDQKVLNEKLLFEIENLKEKIKKLDILEIENKRLKDQIHKYDLEYEKRIAISFEKFLLEQKRDSQQRSKRK